MASKRTIELLIVISAKLTMVQLTTEQRIYCAWKQSEYFRILSGCMRFFWYTLYSVYKKRLAFEIQISHNYWIYLTSIIAWNHLASRKTKDFLLMGHDRLISFVNKTRFCHVSLTLRTLEQWDQYIYD